MEQVSGVKYKTTSRKDRREFAAVAEIVDESPGLCIYHHYLELGIPQTSSHRILYKDASLKAYKVYITQEFQPCHTSNETID